MALLTLSTGAGSLLLISGSREGDPHTSAVPPASVPSQCRLLSLHWLTFLLCSNPITGGDIYQTRTRSLPPKFCFIKNSGLWIEYSGGEAMSYP